LHTRTITDDLLDAMGHMNIRHYLGIFDDGAWNFFRDMGLSEDYYQTRDAGMFALRQFITYVHEVRVGEQVSIHARLVGLSEKRIHFMVFMVNDTLKNVAATLESLGSHADLKTRSTAPFPDDIRASIQRRLDDHQNLAWQPPLCGVLKP